MVIAAVGAVVLLPYLVHVHVWWTGEHAAVGLSPILVHAADRDAIAFGSPALTRDLEIGRAHV